MSPRNRTIQAGLAIVYRNIEDLEKNPKNPRRHSKKQIRQIARSIEAFGFNVPFLVDRKLRLIAGHGRLEACKLLGIRQVPTIPLEHLSETQIKAFEIADNRLAENAVWDDRLLAEHFKTLSDVKLEFNLEVTGFKVSEINLMIEDLSLFPTAEKDAADHVPKMESAIQVTQAGDLWLLGGNRLLCGNALDDQAYSLLMEGRLAAAVFVNTHNVPINESLTESAKFHHPKSATASSGEMTEVDSIEFLSKSLSKIVRCSEDGALHFLCTDWMHMKGLLAAGDRIYSELVHLCVWVKDSAVQAGLYRSQHELVLVFKSGRRKKKLGACCRDRSDVWNYPRVSYPLTPTEELCSATTPTPKPVALVVDAILDSTASGEIVLDPFLRCGTTLIAAQRAGRMCYAIELNPTLCDVAIRRWQKLTGQTAIHGGSGRSFSELEEVSSGRR